VDPVHAETMSQEPTTFTVEPIPFYRKFKLVKAEVDLPHHPLELAYADSGSELIQLSGKADAVYRVNDADGLELAEGQVAPYVRFFLANTTNAHGDERELVERPADLDWEPDTEKDPAAKAARAAASALVRPLAVSAVPGGYRVEATVVEGVRLIELVLRIDGKGRVAVEGPKVLFEDLPVAEKL
jgi:hypothetical protein